MAMCLTASRAVAQNYFDWEISSGTETITLTISDGHKFVVNSGSLVYDGLGNITVKGGTLNLVLDNSDYIYLHGVVKVQKGTLNLSLGDHYTGGYPTLKRDEGNAGRLFFVESTDVNASNCKLNIQGEEGRHFVIDGNCGFQVVNGGNGGYTVTYGSPHVPASYAIVCSHGGVIDMDYVTLQKNWNTISSPFEGGGAVNIYDYETDGSTGTKAKCESRVTMDSCVIDGCYAHGSGAALRLRAFSSTSIDTSSLIMNKCVMKNCFSQGATEAQGGVIRTWGKSKCNLEMHGCLIENNYNRNYNTVNEYGLFHWNAFATRPLIIDSCVINNNWSKYVGGGIAITSKGSINIQAINLGTAKYNIF